MDVAFSNGTLLSVVESNLLSWQQAGLFEDFYGTPLANKSIGYKPGLVTAAFFTHEAVLREMREPVTIDNHTGRKVCWGLERWFSP